MDCVSRQMFPPDWQMTPYTSNTTILIVFIHLNSISLYYPMPIGEDVADPSENGGQAHHGSGRGFKQPRRLLHSLVPTAHLRHLGTM